MNANFLGKIALAILSGVAVLSVIGVMEAESETLRDDIDRNLANLGTTHVTIGGDQFSSSEKAKQQMEELIVWNAMAASHCRVLGASHALQSVTYGDTANDIDEVDPNDKVFRYHRDDREFQTMRAWMLGYADVDSIPGNSVNGFYGIHGYETLIESGFSRQCLGTRSAVRKVKSLVPDLPQMAKDVAWGVVTAGTAPAVIMAKGGLTLASKLIPSSDSPDINNPSTVAEVMTSLYEKLYYPPPEDVEFDNQWSFDMEGSFSKIEFTANDTVRIGETGTRDPIYGLNFAGDWKGDQITGFWRGKRFMHAVPPGLEPYRDSPLGDSLPADDGADCCALNDWFRFRGISTFDGQNNFDGVGDDRSHIRTLYAWRVRMKDVPIAADKEIDEDEINCGGSGCNPEARSLVKFLDQTEFVICEGAEGYVQSNAGWVHEEDDVSNDGPLDSEQEDHVYPFIRLTSGQDSCIGADSGAQDLGDADGVDGSDNNQQIEDFIGEIEDETGYDFSNNLECETRHHVGSSQTLFEKETADGGKDLGKLLCGGDTKRINLIHYGPDPESEYKKNGEEGIEVFVPDPKYKGCSTNTHDITDESVESGTGTDFYWMHNAVERTKSSGNIIERKDQLKYSSFETIDYRKASNENKAEFKIDLEYMNGRDTLIFREEVSGDKKEIEVNGESFEFEEFETPSLKIDREKGKLRLNGESSEHEMDITIQGVDKNLEKLRIESLSGNEADLSIEKVEVDGEERLCNVF